MVFANVCRGLDHLYSDQQLCDLRVVVGDKTFECHRLVLAAVSQFFQSSLTSSWRESSSREVSIEHEDVPAESFSLLMDIVYKGKEVITIETVKDVLKMSIFLQAQFLEDYCQQYMADNMVLDNCLGIWQFAEKYELTSLSSKAFNMAATEFPKISKCSEFVQLPKAMFLTLLASQQSGEDLCRAVFQWAEGDVDTRKFHLGEFLPFINFLELSQEYLSTLLHYLDHAFKDYVFHVITVAVKHKLNTQDKVLRREIQALFRFGVSDEFVQCVTIVTGSSDSEKPHAVSEALCFPIEAQRYKIYPLPHLPEVCGMNFSTCVRWNILYVSGGSENPTFFAEYSAGWNAWKVLTAMPEGREKHAMAAVDRVVFVVGGLQQGCVAQKVPAADVMAFDTRTDTWRLFCRLILAVSDAAVISLGHRLYVFGGQNAEGQATDVVQCVDTMTGCVYQAGRLPSPQCGVRAVSDGGTIYIVTSEGHVLRMKENFSFADTREAALGKLKSAEAVPVTNDSNEEEGTVVNADETKSPCTATVNFVRVGQFEKPRLQGFGAFLTRGRLVVCGGCSEEGLPLQDIIALDLKSAEKTLWKRRTGLLGGNIAVNIVRIPKEFLNEATATLQPLIIGDQIKLDASQSRSGVSATGFWVQITRNCIGSVKDVQPDGNITADFPFWPGYMGPASDFILV